MRLLGAEVEVVLLTTRLLLAVEVVLLVLRPSSMTSSQERPEQRMFWGVGASLL
jgi:hypothetical protein